MLIDRELLFTTKLVTNMGQRSFKEYREAMEQYPSAVQSLIQRARASALVDQVRAAKEE